MGSDDLFKKRKARAAGKLSRKAATRSRYEKVLIVCEGKKTEPHYFAELKNYYKLNSANIEITGECGSSPINVCDYAMKLYSQEKAAGDPYDRVYCVFDKDTHTTYDTACDKLARAKPKKTYHIINSVPSFEYWLLLHFEFSSKPFHKEGKNSASDEVEKQLKKYIPDYKKGDKSMFSRLADQLPQAIRYSERTLKSAEEGGYDNPSTKVHQLITFLQNIK